MKAILALSLFSFIFTSCGPSGGKQELKKNYNIVYSGNQEAYFLPHYDPDCGKTESPLTDLSAIKVWIAVKSGSKLQVEQQEFNLSGFSGDGLSNRTLGISGLYSDSVFIESSFRENQLTRSFPVNICRTEYPRESLENAALAVAVALQRGYDFYQSLETSKPLRGLDVLIQPKAFKEKLLSEDTVEHTLLTDTAFMAVSAAGEKSVLVVSPERVAFNFAGRLWEQPSVIVHEFAHHVYAHYSLFDNGHALLKSSPLLPDQPNYVFGLNEGFADLFSWLSLSAPDSNNSQAIENRLFINKDDEKDIGLRNISDPLIPFVYMNHPKRFSVENYKFKGFRYMIGADPHVIGAVFANIAYRTLLGGIQNPTAQKARALGSRLLHWISMDMSGVPFDRDGEFQEQYMIHAIDLFMQSSLDNQSGENLGLSAQNQCSIFKRDFGHFFPTGLIPACSGFAGRL